MQTRTIQHGDVKVVVQEATTAMGIKRSMTLSEMYKQEGLDDIIRWAWATLADLRGATTEVEGLDWPIEAEALLELPEALTAPWWRAANELNPHWNLPIERDEKKKSRSKSTGG